MINGKNETVYIFVMQITRIMVDGDTSISNELVPKNGGIAILDIL